MPQSLSQSHGEYPIPHFIRRNPFSHPFSSSTIWKSKVAKRVPRATLFPMVTTAAFYEKVKEDALHLPHEDRSRLASRLLESLDDDDDISPEWKDELDRRMQDIDEEKAVMIPHAEVMASARARLAKNRELRASQGS